MNLNYKTFGDGFPLVILHGLMGSLDNWLSLAKRFSTAYRVWIIDQRNHGKSPFSNEFSYHILVNDLHDFFEQNGIEKAHIIGHSMGGKVAMDFAAQYPEMVEKLVVVDVAPVAYDDRHSHIFKALLAIDLSRVAGREDVETQLHTLLNGEDERTIQFLMKGLYRNDENNFAWRFNVPVLWKAYNEISDRVGGSPFLGQALFIKGQKSNYITAENFSAIDELFPNNELEEIANAGHWLHADAPQVFAEVVERFLQA
ncbi:MAG: alpha/beta fold hydrolase [Chitinophagales bacterium]|nr:alpha/beta fold hydrolase [Chitinophagales bacterium]